MELSFSSSDGPYLSGHRRLGRRPINLDSARTGKHRNLLKLDAGKIGKIENTTFVLSVSGMIVAVLMETLSN